MSYFLSLTLRCLFFVARSDLHELRFLCIPSRVCDYPIARVIILGSATGGSLKRSIGLKSSAISASYVCRHAPRTMGQQRGLVHSVPSYSPSILIPRFLSPWSSVLQVPLVKVLHHQELCHERIDTIKRLHSCSPSIYSTSSSHFTLLG